MRRRGRLPVRTSGVLSSCHVDVAFHGGGAAGQGQPGSNGLLVAHNCIQIITFCMRHAGGRRFEPGEPNGGYLCGLHLLVGHVLLSDCERWPEDRVPCSRVHRRTE